MCGQCEQAKTILRAHGVEIEERKIGAGWTREQLLEQVPTARSVPQIFIDERYVGGVSELRNQINSLKAAA